MWIFTESRLFFHMPEATLDLAHWIGDYSWSVGGHRKCANVAHAPHLFVLEGQQKVASFKLESRDLVVKICCWNLAMVCWWLRIGGRPFLYRAYAYIFSYVRLIYTYLWNVYIYKYPQVIPFSVVSASSDTKNHHWLLEIGGLSQQAWGEVATMASLHSHVGRVSLFDVPRRKDELKRMDVMISHWQVGQVRGRFI